MKLLGVFSALLCSIWLVSATNPELTEENIRQMTLLAQTLQNAKAQERNISESVLTDLPIGRACLYQSHCAFDEECVDMLHYSRVVANMFDASSEISKVNKKVRITGRECSKSAKNYVKNINQAEFFKHLQENVENINRILENKSLTPMDFDITKLTGTFDLDSVQSFDSPQTRQAGGASVLDEETMEQIEAYYRIIMRGEDEVDSFVQDTALPIITLLLQQGVLDTNKLDETLNPFMLFTMSPKDQKDAKERKRKLILQITQLHQAVNKPAKTATSQTKQSDGYFAQGSNPNYQPAEYTPNYQPGNTPNYQPGNLPNYQPGYNTGYDNKCQGGFLDNPLMLYSLLGNNANEDSSLLYFFLSGNGGFGGNGCGGNGDTGLSSIIPLLLFSNSSLFGGSSGSSGSGGISDILLYSLVLGDGNGLFGGSSKQPGNAGGLDITSLLLFSGLGNSGSGGLLGNNSDLLFLLLAGQGGDKGYGGGLGGGNGDSGLSSIIPLLLFSNSSLFGGSSSSSGSGISDILLYSLVLGGGNGIFGGDSKQPGNAGGLGDLFPLIFLLDNDNSGSGGLFDGDNSMLLYIALSGGLGNGGGYGGSGGSGIGSILPYLITLGDSSSSSSSSSNMLFLFSLLGGGGLGGLGGGYGDYGGNQGSYDPNIFG